MVIQQRVTVPTTLGKVPIESQFMEKTLKPCHENIRVGVNSNLISNSILEFKQEVENLLGMQLKLQQFSENVIAIELELRLSELELN